MKIQKTAYKAICLSSYIKTHIDFDFQRLYFIIQAFRIGFASSSVSVLYQSKNSGQVITRVFYLIKGAKMLFLSVITNTLKVTKFAIPSRNRFKLTIFNLFSCSNYIFFFFCFLLLTA